MEEGLIHQKVIVIAHDQAAIVAQPGEGAFDLPAFSVAAQRAPILQRRFAATLAMRTDQNNTTLDQAPAQRVAVVSAIGNDAKGPLLGSSAAATRHGDLCQCRFGQLYFCRTCRGKLTSQRNTLAVDHHHPLRALAALGFADAKAPFLAGAKVPSKKLSLQSSRPRWSSWRRNARQILSHTPRSSQSRRRRQQVLALGYFFGRSRHRAPVLSTQRMPSSTCRLSAQRRPLLCSLGSSGSMRCHCSSLRNDCCIPSLSSLLIYKVQTFFQPAGNL